MIVTTTPTVEGHPIAAYHGIVTGEAILGANIFRDLFARITDIIGGRSGAYEPAPMKRNWARRGPPHLQSLKTARAPLAPMPWSGPTSITRSSTTC